MSNTAQEPSFRYSRAGRRDINKDDGNLCRIGSQQPHPQIAIRRLEMARRGIKVVQTSRETGKESSVELCWRYLCIISRGTDGRKMPSEVLDAMLWGDSVLTERFAYRIETPPCEEQRSHDEQSRVNADAEALI
jgi:hypothetical protein